jgi:tungstate transport system permease protein
VDLIFRGIVEAISRLVSLDREILAAAEASLAVSGTATVLSLALAVPLGVALGLGRFPGRGAALALVNTGMGLPPVTVGLFVAVFVWRSGPFGDLGLYCTRGAMVLAQVLIASPMVIGLTAIAVQALNPMLRLQIAALGATRWQALWLFVQEAKLALLTTAMAAFGAVVSEIGASLMVGCNIRGDTRILTTAIALETSKGEFGTAFALAFVLLGLTFFVNSLVTWIQQRQRPL